MCIKDIIEILEAQVMQGAEDDFSREIKTACGSDMMSDVLAFVKDQSVLLTGLVNLQVIRTADMMDMCCIVFVRGKKPDADMIDLAQKRKIVLLTTDKRMFKACGLLYTSGLRG